MPKIMDFILVLDTAFKGIGDWGDWGKRGKRGMGKGKETTFNRSADAHGEAFFPKAILSSTHLTE